MEASISHLGFALLPNLVSPDIIERLKDGLGPVSGAGERGMLPQPLVQELATSEALLAIAQGCAPGLPRPVRAILFNKSPERSWIVPWHQDLTISVTHRIETEGFGPWSKKNGLVHVQPPIAILENMVTLRIHLDETDETNGALRVLPGSHRHGRLTFQDIERLRGEISEKTCRAKSGDVLVMRPLLLHASGHSTAPGNRRVLHVEYAGADLPLGLQWNPAA